MVKTIQGMTRGMEERITNVKNYLSLRDINSGLAEENSYLRNRLELLSNEQDPGFHFCKRFNRQVSNTIIHRPG